MGVKLPGEQRGYTRFRKIAEMLVEAGFAVDLITSSFQHWEKAQRDRESAQYRGLPYEVVFVDEPGYKRNLDLSRISSHARAARNLAHHFADNPWRYDLIYSEIPPNDVALAAAEAAQAGGIPFVADVNDLWPEAMRMAFDVPVVSDIAFRSFAKDAAKVYRMLDAAVGTSDEYAARPAADRDDPYPRLTVYVGNDLTEFDTGVAVYADEIVKPDGEMWVAYAGTLGASYDIATLIEAAALLVEDEPHLRLKLLGDGPERESLEDLAQKCEAPVDFLGYVDYPVMAAWLSKCDITVNSLHEGAAQSIVTKIGDYLAAGIPLVNTGQSPEFCSKVERDGFGVNVEPENIGKLALAIQRLVRNSSARKIMGARARAVAEAEFDQRQSYLKIVHLVQRLLV
ncbi:MAG: glycosyltransferase family 4 protein [Eggerthellaceae bacterium]|nr:glycosyltransferase family 4 protein [Eggerthellaceae bacterium]